MTSRNVSMLFAILGGAILAASCAPDQDMAQQVPPRPVRVEVARPGPHSPTLTLIGRIVPSDLVSVVAVRPGTLRLAPRFEGGLRGGETVGKGELLAEIEAPALDADVRRAALEADGARAEREMLAAAHEGGVLSRRDHEKASHAHRVAEQGLAAARLLQSETVLRSPRAGRLVVEQRLASGAHVAAGTVLARVAGDGPPHVEAWCSAADRARLRPGLAARIAPAGGDETAVGIVSSVAVGVEDTGAARVVIDVTEATGLPAPGEGVEIRVELEQREAALTVPEEAIVIGSGGVAVFVLRPSQTEGVRWVARELPVQVGTRGGGRVEVLSGLSDGEKVIVSGVAFLQPGDSVDEMAETKDEAEK